MFLCLLQYSLLQDQQGHIDLHHQCHDLSRTRTFFKVHSILSSLVRHTQYAPGVYLAFHLSGVHCAFHVPPVHCATHMQTAVPRSAVVHEGQIPRPETLLTNTQLLLACTQLLVACVLRQVGVAWLTLAESS